MADCKISNMIRKKLDTFEQMVLLVLCSYLFIRLWPDSFSDLKPYLLLLMISEGVVVVLVLIRAPTNNISFSLRDWLVAFTCSFLPLLIIDGGRTFMPEIGVSIIFLGMLIHIGAKLCLLRSFGIVPANRGVKVNGFYSYIRHPMYAGYFLTHFGYLLAAPALWNFVIYSTVWILLLYRIVAEEKILSLSSDYKDYINRVPYRLIPGIF